LPEPGRYGQSRVAGRLGFAPGFILCLALGFFLVRYSLGFGLLFGFGLCLALGFSLIGGALLGLGLGALAVLPGFCFLISAALDFSLVRYSLGFNLGALAVRAVKPKLPTRIDLDGRSNAAKTFDAITEAIYGDLGGKDELSAIELRLVEAFAGASVMTETMNVKLMLGQPVDPTDFCQVASTLCRVGSRLGLRRRPKIVEDASLAQYLRERDAATPVVQDPDDEVLS
jgi:hypothetical protein